MKSLFFFAVLCAVFAAGLSLKCYNNFKLIDCATHTFPHSDDPNAEKFCVKVVSKEEDSWAKNCGVIFWQDKGFQERAFRCEENGHTDVTLNGEKYDRFCCDTDGCNQ
ncbi:hypothetical protein QR680_013359 [Steinernema hermaphroditum]|uniref:Uncharacterized protein n=1 Tax=Steinernema hermaphroditum TaxID=289476 RepID=A0AA39I6M1_9BILA|nr:hypothetical protein QR680_013359 [Steinernema hermaphroditum]